VVQLDPAASRSDFVHPLVRPLHVDPEAHGEVGDDAISDSTERKAALGASAIALLAVLGCGGCGEIAYEAADQASARGVPERIVAQLEVPDGYRAVLYAEGFNYPSAMAWDDQGRLYVVQSHSVPLPLTVPKIVRVETRDGKEEVVDVPLEGRGAPTGKVAVGLVFHDGWFYLSHEEKDGTWGISRFRPDGKSTEAVLRGLPGNADHWVNHLMFDRRGALYFGVGSATNSGVVSSHDPVNLKWLKDRPAARDIPCRDLTLTAATFTEDDALTEPKDDHATTGPYQAYGASGAKVVRGEVLCTGAVYRLDPGATVPTLLAWGFRNPVGLALGPDGEVYIGAQGADVRGSRPVSNDADAVYRLHDGGWYGWPDFGGDLRPWSDAQFAVDAAHSSAGMAGPVPVIDLSRSGLTPPDRAWLLFATAPHAAICGMDVVPPGGAFARFAGQILVSEMGDFRPTTDPIHPDVRAGFHVEAIDPRTGRATVLVRNRRKDPSNSSQPASALDLEHGLERPVDVKVGPDGSIYVLDFGVWVPTAEAAKIFPKTGKVFRIEPIPGAKS
jgi:glucose/arabinose dehydrogenase